MSSPLDLRGRRCLVTGATSGIGLATAVALARRGAHLLLVGRDRARGERARRQVSAAAAQVGSPAPELLLADFSEMREVAALADTLRARAEPLHVLVSNAGVITRERRTSSDGLETQFAVNHLAPFLLVTRLLDLLRASAPSRVVVVASQVEAGGSIDFDDLQRARRYDALGAYDQSKLANVHFTYELARRLAGSGVTANCLHPGVIATNLLDQYFARPRLLSFLTRRSFPGPEQGAQAVVRLAADADLAAVSGRYFKDGAESLSSPHSRDPVVARRLWEVSEALVAAALAR